ncbi:MAG: hypothetical protein NT105_17900 [Verrucomicrobia bacterium]|nr:hypothetical protein [Verrucomicrobiota bacterium]
MNRFMVMAAVVVLLAAGCGKRQDANQKAEIDWPARAAMVKVGMTRAEVEKILPTWYPPSLSKGPIPWSSGFGNGYTMTEQHLVAADWRVIATYDVSKGKGMVGWDNDQRLIVPIKINKIMHSAEDKKFWMAKAASIKAGMTRVQAERNIPAWNGCGMSGLFEGFENREVYEFSDSWTDAGGKKSAWSLTIYYDATGGRDSLENRVISPVKVEEPAAEFRPGMPMQSRAQELRVALQYHLDQGDGAPMSDRIALAKAFRGLQEYEQRAVLSDELWPRARCKEFRPVLEAMLRLPDKTDPDAGGSPRLMGGPVVGLRAKPGRGKGDAMANAIMGRLSELGSTSARELLLKDIRSGRPRLDLKGLASLPEEPLPELDAAFRGCLNREQSCDLFKMSFVIGRYGSPVLLDQVKRFYVSANGGWACTIQADLLRYLIKHDPPYGLAQLELALSFRGQPGKNNCFGDVIYETVHGLKEQEIRAFAIKQLAADHPRIRYSATKYLLESDEPDVRREVIRMLTSLPPITDTHGGQFSNDLRGQLLSLFFRLPAYRQTHLPSLAELDQLEANLSSAEKAHYQRQIAELRTILRK